jgi:hypothetical protein
MASGRSSTNTYSLSARPKKPCGDHHRDLGDAELPGGEYPGMAGNQSAVLAHQRRRRPAPLLDACGYRGDLGIRVGPGVFRNTTVKVGFSEASLIRELAGPLKR